MIDTMRFRIALNEHQYECIRRASIQLEKRNNANDSTIFRILRQDLPIGSYNRNVNLFVNEDKECFLEFSVPKFAMGHNIYMVAPEEVPKLLEKLCGKLKREFRDFPEVIFWEVMRIDLCYAWKLRSHDVAARVMEALQKLEVARKKKSSYASSVMFIAPTMSLKFYLKDDEFYAHDFKELKRLGFTDEAYELYEKSKGVLRFEITMRKKQIDRVLPYYDLFNSSAIEVLLKKALTSVLHGANEAITLDEVADRLVTQYGKKRGFHLYSFYKVYYGEPNGRTKLKRYLARSTVYANLRYLAKANVGLQIDHIPDDFNLRVPSEYSVNELHPPTGGVATPVIVTPDKRLINWTL